jgi:hypothetical protein
MAREAGALAAAAALESVRETHLRAAERWNILADGLESSYGIAPSAGPDS